MFDAVPLLLGMRTKTMGASQYNLSGKLSTVAHPWSPESLIPLHCDSLLLPRYLCLSLCFTSHQFWNRSPLHQACVHFEAVATHGHTNSGIQASNHPDPWWPDNKTSGPLTHLGFLFTHMVWHYLGTAWRSGTESLMPWQFSSGLLKSSRACIHGQGFLNQGPAGCGGGSICRTHS